VVWVLIGIKVGLGFAVGLSHYRFSDGINKKGQPLGEPFLILLMVRHQESNPGATDYKPFALMLFEWSLDCTKYRYT